MDIRKDFPILLQENRGKPLVYLDSAATSLTPSIVSESEIKYYNEFGGSVHRSVYELGEKATNAYENSRKNLAKFIGAKTSEIIFTKSATESINLVAQTFYDKYMSAGDEIILSLMEHHSNLIPWYFLRDKYGVVIKFANITESGEIDVNHFESLITPKTKIAALTHLSNVYGSKTVSYTHLTLPTKA